MLMFVGVGGNEAGLSNAEIAHTPPAGVYMKKTDLKMTSRISCMFFSLPCWWSVFKDDV